jgi:putative FmdB family regulatory protein
VPNYEYRCPRCGVFEVPQAMGFAPRSQPCKNCGAESGRSFSIPYVNRSPTPLTMAIARAERSRDEPEVVTRMPPRKNRRPQPPDPRLKGLPAPSS